MPYVKLMALLKEVNRPPGGKDSLRRVVQNCFITNRSKVLHGGCNTGSTALEIAHLAKCKIIGVDISPHMILAARRYKQRDPLGKLVTFQVADVMRLPFKDESFDAVVAPGSTAFVADKTRAINEYRRVLKPWGFLAEINFFYHHKPPRRLITEMNKLMKINIQPWDMSYWLNLYDNCQLERYYTFTGAMQQVSKRRVVEYCRVMAKSQKFSPLVERALARRLISIMSLFNENHRYLSYGIFILRKRPELEQISLFGA